jgi:hypothetical protein
MKFRFALSVLALAALPAAAMEAHFGPIGITPFETARLNAFCDGSVTPTPCDVTFEFHDSSGNLLKQASMTLQPESIGSVDFSLTGIAAVPNRVELAPCIKVQRGTAQASLELMENFTHRTRLLINWGDGALPRSGADVDFGGLGITPFDTARMSAMCVSSTSTDVPGCVVSFEFHDASGNVVKSARMTIPVEGSAHLDLTLANAIAGGGRVTINPCWTVASGGAVLSVQTFDNSSGLTLTQAYPAALVPAIVP